MESLYLLIPIAIIFVCIAVAVFIWAVKTEQFDDLDRQGHSILFDDNDEIKTKIEKKEKQ
ncbi:MULTISPECIES: cbb3-type cytochrome oxidase assembly protein CcoS [Vibrio]|uniref:Cbb3-type cytochrome oxidase assembly protein CcoS n=1 Tax=Vibrio casei TaxID=673372 RepID=A0A368LMW8_9VIBR|nr:MULTISPECIES: cbb3-type cytochrome oxidase assembly protein CcoS [Vibrio]RCS73250.1 cbb3-type cytochrome oxidase assembly protein CcoS [Vibrio casei]SJN18534.1 Type cbb3 cytochrome oxidase biogenesis protein CcoS, involved in heme b insertion [Vibrio casei]HBV75714.1 cbb3-type cytochrome oxidase assembly protein CcoS [Vibrio sp.]